MNKLDFHAINLALDPSSVLPKWLPLGQVQGKEYVSPNPTRADKNPGSFTINLKEGHWKDYATGDGGSDLVSLYAYLFHQDDQGEAAKELAQNLGVKIGDPMVREEAAKAIAGRIPEAKPEPIIPVPFAATKPDFEHFRYGPPTAVYTYMDADGDVLLYVCRFDPPGERKQVVPRSWCKHPDGSARWTWRGITGATKRPLYGLDRLAASPDADVVLVEGEKATDAGQELLGDAAVVVSWMGGTDTADKANLKPLAGRRVILWPDSDALADKETGAFLPLHEQPGMKAMMQHALALKGVAREVHMVAYTMDAERHGWDLADAKAEGWDGRHVLEYMGKHAGDPKAIAAGKPPAPPAPPPAAAPPGGDDDAERHGLALDASVNPFGFPDTTSNGQPMNTVENLAYMLGEYAITTKYNQVRKRVELALPGRRYSADNEANCGLAEITSMASRNRMPVSMIADYIKLLADRNSFNPVKQFIASKPWDGVTRIQALCDTVRTSDNNTKLRDQLIRRWLVSAVAAIFMPFGFESHGVLVFTGDQGQGKTKWIKRLVPPELLDVVLVGAVLDPNNKDTVTNAISHWLVELGELDATFRKADIARLKSFVTNATDKVRRPYDRIESEYQRRTVFFASVNEDRYLVDDTGNRRWWTVPVLGINYMHTIDMQQVWAEVFVLFGAGEQHWLTDDERVALNTLNAEHESVDPVEEMILSNFDFDALQGLATREMTASDVLLAIGFDKPTKATATHASKVLKKLTGSDPMKRAKGRFFKMPPRIKGSAAERRFEHFDDSRPF